MKTTFQAVLAISFLIACNATPAAWFQENAASAATAQPAPPPPPPPANEITGFAPDLTIHTTVDAISYLTIYGNFTDVAGASVVLSSDACEFDADIWYWDEETVVIELTSLGAPTQNRACAARQDSILEDTVTVTVTNSNQQTSPPIGATPQPVVVP